ncbi:hypothetical protein [Pseudomonas sp. NPDC090592]|uniref:hypothetical protein n=1 Tax=Pseudomonas sp. NPDC090592 TaxID=3364480 RepID=UPI00383BEAF2
MLFILFNPFLAAPAAEFSPQACKVKDPEGLTYIALGKAVLRLPITQLAMTHALAFDSEPLPPRDPDEPQGCPNNPLQQQSLILNFGFDNWLKDRKRPSTLLLEEIRLIASPTDYWGIRYEDMHSAQCKVFSRRKHLSNGLVGCLPPKTAENSDSEDAGSYTVSKEIYHAPFDKVFAISCLPSVPKGTRCNVSYKILPSVNLVYTFLTATIKLEDAIDLDRQIRDSVWHAVVPNYKWN